MTNQELIDSAKKFLEIAAKWGIDLNITVEDKEKCKKENGTVDAKKFYELVKKKFIIATADDGDEQEECLVSVSYLEALLNIKLVNNDSNK